MKREKSSENIFKKVKKLAKELIIKISKSIKLRKVESFQSGENVSRPVSYTRIENGELIEYKIDRQNYSEEEVVKLQGLLQNFIYGFPERVDAYITPDIYAEKIDESSITLTFSKDYEYDISVKSALAEMCASLDIPLIVNGEEKDAYQEFVKLEKTTPFSKGRKRN